MKNLLTLHEAVAVVLLSEPNRTATFQTIADKIEKRNLFPEKKRRNNLSLTNKIEDFNFIKQIQTLVNFIPPNYFISSGVVVNL